MKYLFYFLLCALLICSAVAYFAPETVVDYFNLLEGATPEKTKGYYIDMVEMVGIELFIIVISIVTGLLVYRRKQFVQTIDEWSARTKDYQNIFIAVVISLFTIISVVTAVVTLRQFPNSADEFVYLFQAEDLGRGRLWSAVHDLPEFFEFHHLVQKDDKWVGRFPPGYPLLQSITYVLNIPPFWLNVVFGGLLLLIVYRFAQKYYDQHVAAIAIVILAFSGFYIYNAASFFSHVTSAFFAVSFVALLYAYIERGKFWFGAFAGLMIGMLAITRYYTAVLLFLPFFFYSIFTLKGSTWKLFIALGVGGILPILVLFFYNYVITGNPLLPTTTWAFDDESLGFVKGHTPALGIKHVVKRILMFIYWCSPQLLILYLLMLFRKTNSKSERGVHLEDYFFVSLIIGYFFYYHSGGNQYGPRFYFEALPFLVLFTTAKVLRTRSALYISLLISGVVFQVLKLPVIAAHESAVVDERNDVYDLVHDNDIKNAVVFIASPVSPRRPMPAEDLNRNNHDYQNDVIYARDLGNENRRLAEYYPEKSCFIYKRDADNPQGTLEQITFK